MNETTGLENIRPVHFKRLKEQSGILEHLKIYRPNVYKEMSAEPAAQFSIRLIEHPEIKEKVFADIKRELKQRKEFAKKVRQLMK